MTMISPPPAAVSTAPLSLYDLAEVYDAILPPGPCEAFYREEARRAGGPVLELACGTGRLTIPVFGFANAGVSFEHLTVEALTDDLTLGVALGLLLGKVVGLFGSAWLMIRLGLADVPMGAGRLQLFGVALLCGIGFTMSLFIGLLAFADDLLLQEEVKVGILSGSVAAGLLGWAILRVAPRDVPAPEPRVR